MYSTDRPKTTDYRLQTTLLFVGLLCSLTHNQGSAKRKTSSPVTTEFITAQKEISIGGKRCNKNIHKSLFTKLGHQH